VFKLLFHPAPCRRVCMSGAFQAAGEKIGDGR
jgi:hypothetical protein